MGCRSSHQRLDDEPESTKFSTSAPSDETSSKKKAFLKKQLTISDFQKLDGDAKDVATVPSTDPQSPDGLDEKYTPRGSFQYSAPSSGPANGVGSRKSLKRSFSMTSEVDKKEKKMLSVEKAQQHTGDDVDPEALGMFVTCRRGSKARSMPNQDSWSVLKTQRYIVYGVYDGHGRKGHDVSNFVKINLPKIIENDERFGVDGSEAELFTDAFEEMDSLIQSATDDQVIDAKSSGTTCTVIIHDLKEEKLTIAHVGDSGAAIARGEQYETEYLTPDHKPGLPKEKERIRAAGGEVEYDGYNHRVYKVGENYPALNMSRAFGDIRGKDAGIISTPDICEVKLMPDDQFFLLCSDGVWEFMEPSDVSATCSRALAANQNPAKELAVEALARWRENADGVVDDITVVLADLKTLRGVDDARPIADDSVFTVDTELPTPKTMATPKLPWLDAASTGVGLQKLA